jgi:hypothetical protein
MERHERGLADAEHEEREQERGRRPGQLAGKYPARDEV